MPYHTRPHRDALESVRSQKGQEENNMNKALLWLLGEVMGEAGYTSEQAGDWIV